MPLLTHTSVDTVGAQGVGVLAVEAALVLADTAAGAFRTSDGAGVLDRETVSFTPTAGAYPTSWSLELAANENLVPAGTCYRIRQTLAGPDGPTVLEHTAVVPNGPGPYRLLDCLNTPAAGAPLVVGWTPAGYWLTNRTYHLRQVVSWAGRSWVARRTSVGVEPGTDDTAWQVVGEISATRGPVGGVRPLDFAATLTPDAAASTCGIVDPTGNFTLAAPVNGEDGQPYTLVVAPSGAGRVVTIDTPIVITTTAAVRSLTVPSARVGYLELRRHGPPATGVWHLMRAFATTGG